MTTTTTQMGQMGQMIRPARRLALALGTVALCLAAASSLAQPTDPAPVQPAKQALAHRFDAAMQAYECNHWPQAFEALRQLAEAGHTDASRIVMQMHHHGQRLYGQPFVLTPQQRERFSQQR